MTQQKKTDIDSLWLELTPEEQEFVIHLAAPGTSQSAAYRAAFPEKNWTDGAIRVAACRMANKPNVALTLDSLRAEGLDKARVTLDEHMKELARLSKRAELAGNYGAAVQAEQLRGKAAGLYVEKREDVTPISGRTQALIAQLAEIDPDKARELADKLGIPVETRH